MHSRFTYIYRKCDCGCPDTSAANLPTVFGGNMPPISHGLQDVSECAHSEPNSPPKAGEGTSDGEMPIDKDEESSKRTYMPFDSDLCELSDHDSDGEAHTGSTCSTRRSQGTLQGDQTSSCGPQYHGCREKFVQRVHRKIPCPRMRLCEGLHLVHYSQGHFAMAYGYV